MRKLPYVIRRKRRIRIPLSYLWEIVDPRQFFGDTLRWENPSIRFEHYGSCHVGAVPVELRGAGYGAYKRRGQANTRFSGNPKAFRAYARLTHDAWRFGDVCPLCRAEISPAQREELEALMAAFPWPRPLPDQREGSP